MHITTETHGLKFIWKSGMLFIELPSKRRLCYVKPRIGENRFGGESVTYEGIGATKKWERLESYGPKFVENIVQAISRDLLMSAMKTLSHRFICGHVHDELIIECKPDVSLDELCRQMARVPEWMARSETGCGRICAPLVLQGLSEESPLSFRFYNVALGIKKYSIYSTRIIVE